MNKKPGLKFFLEQVPALSKWKTALPTYISQLLIFILTILFFYWISQKILLGAIIGQIIVSFIGTLPYRYIVINSKNIRQKYKEKYKDFAGQKFWYHYQSYTVPLLSSSLYFPLMLKTDYFLPAIVDLPEHFITKSLLPLYIILPLGIFLCILGLVIRKNSGGFDSDVEAYFYVLFPEKGKLITDGTYHYIRNPRYLGRGFLAIGFGILSNNFLGLTVSIIHFIAFSSLILSEEKELSKRFGKDYLNYKKRVPVLFPKYGTWKKFLKTILD